MTTEKKTGVRKIPKRVTPIIPLNTAVPSACLISDPGANRADERQNTERERERSHQDRPQT